MAVARLLLTLVCLFAGAAPRACTCAAGESDHAAHPDDTDPPGHDHHDPNCPAAHAAPEWAAAKPADTADDTPAPATVPPAAPAPPAATVAPSPPVPLGSPHVPRYLSLRVLRN